MTIAWPTVLAPRSVSINIAMRTLGGVPALSGFTQVVASDLGVWKLALIDIPIGGAAKVLALRQMQALLQGRLNACLLPIYDKLFTPWPVVRGITLSPDVTRDRSLIGTPYEPPTIPTESVIVASLALSAAQRATQVAINVSYGGELLAGHRFSIGQRLHQIQEIRSKIGTVYTVAIQPPLREAAASGAVVNFSGPLCKARLLTDDELDVQLELACYGKITANFIEDPF